MPETDQRSGADGHDTDRGLRRYVQLGQTAVTGWALVAVLGLAAAGTAMGAEPVPVVQGVLVADSTEVSGSAPAVDPMAFVQVGEALNPAVPLDTVTAVSPPLDTVTAASTPTGQVGPTGQAGPAVPPVVMGPTVAAPVGTIAPAGPAAQLRQAAFTTSAPDQRAGVAIQTAMAQLGLPYVWGGNGPTNGDPGFDCSGLTTFSYAAAGVRLPRTAHTQYNAGPHVPDGAPLQPGDLVFYGTSARVHHVGMYLGAGRMVNAPTFGKPVQVAFYRYRGDDYLGATRPAAAAGSLTEGVLPYIEPVPVPDVALPPAQVQQQAQEQVFPAPTASLPAVLPQPGDPSLPSEKQSAAEAIADGDAEAAAPRSTVTRPTVPLKSDDKPVTPVGGTTTSSSAPTTSTPTSTPTTSTPTSTGTPTSAGTPTSTGTPTSSSSAPTSTSTSPAGSSTSSSAPTSTPTSGSGAGPVAGTTSSASTSTAVPSSTTAPASSTTVEKATGSTTATTSVLPTRTATKTATRTRATTTSVAASKTAVPLRTTAEPTSTSSKTKTVTSASKTVTTTSKSASKDDDESDGKKSDDAKDDSDDSSSKKATKTSSSSKDDDSKDSDSSSKDSDSKDSDSSSKDSDSKDSDSSSKDSDSKDSGDSSSDDS